MFGGTGGLVTRIYQGTDRWIAGAAVPGVLLHPSEDGINDLGETGALPKNLVNRFGYQQIGVSYGATPGRCTSCGAEHRGERRCRHCGIYLQSNGLVDWTAQRDFQAFAH